MTPDKTIHKIKIYNNISQVILKLYVLHLKGAIEQLQVVSEALSVLLS